MAARFGLALSGLRAEVREIGLRKGEGRKPAYLAVNPKGQVPALVLDDGTVVTETPAILLALGEMAPESGLIPQERVARWRVAEFMAWCCWQIPRGFQPGFAPHRFGPAPAEGEIQRMALIRVEEALAYLDTQLEGRDWAVGQAPTAADCTIVLLTIFAGFLGVAPPDSLMAHRRRLFALPALAATLEAEGFSA